MAFAITALVAPKPVMPAAQRPIKHQSRRPQAALPKHAPLAPTHPMSTASPYVGWAKAAGRAHAEGTASPVRRALRARRAPTPSAPTPQRQTPVGRAMPAAQSPTKPQSRRPQVALPKHTIPAPTPQLQTPVGRATPAAHGPIKPQSRQPHAALPKHTTLPAPPPNGSPQ